MSIGKRPIKQIPPIEELIRQQEKLEQSLPQETIETRIARIEKLIHILSWRELMRTIEEEKSKAAG